MHWFDLRRIAPFVNWLNIMAFDLHGTRERPLLALPHTNLTGNYIRTAQITGASLNIYQQKSANTFRSSLAPV